MAFLRKLQRELKAAYRNRTTSSQLVHGKHTEELSLLRRTVFNQDTHTWSVELPVPPASKFDRSKDPMCIRGATLHTGLSLVETCMLNGITHADDGCGGRKPYFGEATMFVSHAWFGTDASFSKLVDALADEIKEQGLNEEDEFFFIDTLSLAQNKQPNPRKLKHNHDCPNHRDVNEFVCLFGVQPEHDRPGSPPLPRHKVQRLICYCAPLGRPRALQRLWCLYEIMLASESNIGVHAALGQLDQEVLVLDIQQRADFVRSVFAAFDPEREAKATYKEDQEELPNKIKRLGGFVQLNALIKGHMRKWVVDALLRVIENYKREPSTGREGEEGTGPSELAHLYHQLAAALHDCGNFQEAIDCYEIALQADKKTGNVKNPEVTAKALNGIGNAYRELGLYQDALHWHGKALDTLNPNDAKIFTASALAQTYNSLGLAHHHLEQFDDAITMFVEAKRLAQSIGNKKLMAIIENNRGLAELCDTRRGLILSYQTQLQALNDKYELRTRSKNGLDMNRHGTLFKSDTSIGLAHGNLGLAQYRLEDLNSARWNLEEALEIFVGAYGEGHVVMATTYNNLGIIMLELGVPTVAKKHLTRAYRIWRSVFNRNHNVVVSVLVNLGHVNSHLGNLEESRRNFEDAWSYYLQAEEDYTEAKSLADKFLPQDHSLKENIRVNLRKLHATMDAPVWQALRARMGNEPPGVGSSGKGKKQGRGRGREKEGKSP